MGRGGAKTSGFRPLTQLLSQTGPRSTELSCSLDEVRPAAFSYRQERNRFGILTHRFRPLFPSTPLDRSSHALYFLSAWHRDCSL